MQATPRLSEDKVKQCVDPKLNNDYPPKAIAKVYFSSLYIFWNKIFHQSAMLLIWVFVFWQYGSPASSSCSIVCSIRSRFSAKHDHCCKSSSATTQLKTSRTRSSSITYMYVFMSFFFSENQQQPLESCNH